MIVPNELFPRFRIPIKQAKETSFWTFFLHFQFLFFLYHSQTKTLPNSIKIVKGNIFIHLNSLNSKTQIWNLTNSKIEYKIVYREIQDLTFNEKPFHSVRNRIAKLVLYEVLRHFHESNQTPIIQCIQFIIIIPQIETNNNNLSKFGKGEYEHK